MEQIKIRKRLDRAGTCPACRKRSLLHHCIENGVKAVYRAGADLREIWEADLYRCPVCGKLVLTNFGETSSMDEEYRLAAGTGSGCL